MHLMLLASMFCPWQDARWPSEIARAAGAAPAAAAALELRQQHLEHVGAQHDPLVLHHFEVLCGGGSGKFTKAGV